MDQTDDSERGYDATNPDNDPEVAAARREAGSSSLSFILYYIYSICISVRFNLRGYGLINLITN